jgi:hypothetical protein
MRRLRRTPAIRGKFITNDFLKLFSIQWFLGEYYCSSL